MTGKGAGVGLEKDHIQIISEGMTGEAVIVDSKRIKGKYK